MTKFKVGRGFLIASFVFACIGLAVGLLSTLVMSVLESTVKSILIEAGGNANYGGNALAFLTNNLQELQQIEEINFETMDVASLLIVYVCMVFAKKATLFFVIIKAIEFVLLIIALIKSRNPKSKKDLLVPMILSFISVLFSILPLVTGITFAVVKDSDFE